MSFEIINARMVKAYMQDKNAVLIDLRPQNEYLQEHVEGAVHMEMNTFERRIWGIWLTMQRLRLTIKNMGNMK